MKSSRGKSSVKKSSSAVPDQPNTSPAISPQPESPETEAKPIVTVSKQHHDSKTPDPPLTPEPKINHQPPIPKVKLKGIPDVGWQPSKGYYLCKVLLTPNTESGTEMWQAWSKNLDGIQPGIGRTWQDAIRSVKDNIRSYLTTFFYERDNQKERLRGEALRENRKKIPWTEICGYMPHGSMVKWIFLDGLPDPEGNTPEVKDAVKE